MKNKYLISRFHHFGVTGIILFVNDFGLYKDCFTAKILTPGFETKPGQIENTFIKTSWIEYNPNWIENLYFKFLLWYPQ